MAGRGLAGAGIFILAVIVGYLVILFGWLAYAELAGVSDREGAMIMGIVFFFAPVGALLIGIAALVTFLTRRRK